MADTDTDDTASGGDSGSSDSGADSAPDSGTPTRHCFSDDDDSDDAPDSDGSTAAPFPVASTGSDGSNTLPTDLGDLNLWLLDVAGQRMGADPNADDPFYQQYGAPYRITMASGQIFWGYADANGMVTIPNAVASGTCTVEWGADEDAEDDALLPWGLADNPFSDYFAYCEEISLDVGPTDDLEAARKLSNLGYVGELDEQRAAFAEDYSASDNDTIEAVHSAGTAASGSGTPSSQPPPSGSSSGSSGQEGS
jgi:hypothetical protein